MKRFTETEKWHDPWFRRLSPEYKCFWQFILDHCDNAGVWKVDVEVAEFFIGSEVIYGDALSIFEGKIIEFSADGDLKWFVIKFIPFQYGELSEKCPPHKKVLSLMEKHRVNLPLDYPSNRVTVRVQEEEEEEEEVKDKEKDKEEEERKDRESVKALMRLTAESLRSGK